MTIDELLDKLTRAFPSFNAKALEIWAPVFRANFEKHEGPALRNAFTEVLSSFQPGKGRGLHPIVADFVPHLPSGKLNLPSSGPALDIKGHGNRVRSLMAVWRAGQGQRGSKGVPEVLRALEFIAEPIASVRAWDDNPDPLVLTGKELRLAQHRAISQERMRLHGPPGRDADVWWTQIELIARGWGIETKREHWTTDTPKQEAA